MTHWGLMLIAKVTVADRIIKATRCVWLLATTNVDFARTLHNFRLTDSIFESVRRLLSWSGQQHTNILASLKPAYITQLLGVSRQIIRHLGVSRLMYARHNQHKTHSWGIPQHYYTHTFIPVTRTFFHGNMTCTDRP